jgi:tRNA threonylcarbamoyladenosine biosynthesis protein TsaB
MRVGIATAKSLAMALGVPMVPLTSLEVLATGESITEDIIVPVVDARKSEVFWAMYRRTDHGIELLRRPIVGSIDNLVADLMERDQPTVCAGDGAHRYQVEITDRFGCTISGAAHPSASVLAAEGVRRAIRDETVEEHLVEPVYLREPDAQINWSTRQVRP